MIVEIVDSCGKAQVINANQILVRDDLGTPIAASIRVSDRLTETMHANDSEFGKLLRTFGLDRTTVVRPLR